MDKKNVVNANLVIYQPNTPAQFAYNAIANSHAKQIAPFAAGVILRFSLSSSYTSSSTSKGNNGKRKAIEPQPEIQPLDNSTERAEARRLAKETADRQNRERVNQRTKRQDKRTVEQQTALQIIEEAIQQPVGNFTFLQTELTSEQKQELDGKIELLKRYPNISFRIFGHTCDLGTSDAKERLGLQRAENVKKYLISQGIPEYRILSVASKRNTEPFIPNRSEKHRLTNRRVEIFIVR